MSLERLLYLEDKIDLALEKDSQSTQFVQEWDLERIKIFDETCANIRDKYHIKRSVDIRMKDVKFYLKYGFLNEDSLNFLRNSVPWKPPKWMKRADPYYYELDSDMGI